MFSIDSIIFETNLEYKLFYKFCAYKLNNNYLKKWKSGYFDIIDNVSIDPSATLFMSKTNLKDALSKWYLEIIEAANEGETNNNLILKYKSVFVFIYLTGLYAHNIIQFSTKNFLELLNRNPDIKIENEIWTPYYHNKLFSLLLALSQIFNYNINLYKIYGHDRLFFEINSKVLLLNFKRLMLMEYITMGESMGIHTLRHLYLTLVSEQGIWNFKKINTHKSIQNYIYDKDRQAKILNINQEQ